MVVCATGCNPLSYLGYGCYCGFLGSGSPVDPIDKLNNTFLIIHKITINLIKRYFFFQLFFPESFLAAAKCMTGATTEPTAPCSSNTLRRTSGHATIKNHCVVSFQNKNKQYYYNLIKT